MPPSSLEKIFEIQPPLLNHSLEHIDKGRRLSMQQPVERKYPLKAYREQAPNLEVFQFEAKPRFTPIDFNIFALTETAEWSQSDRMRFWYVYGQEEKKPHSASIFDVPPHFVIHKLDREEDAFCHCQIALDGQLIIWSIGLGFWTPSETWETYQERIHQSNATNSLVSMLR